jgi:hypothetical protein
LSGLGEDCEELVEAADEARQHILASELVNNLPPEDWGRVTLSVGVSPEEIKSL